MVKKNKTFSQYIEDMITSASFQAGFGSNARGGFDMPLEAAKRIKKARETGKFENPAPEYKDPKTGYYSDFDAAQRKSGKFAYRGPSAKEYAKKIGTTPDYYDREVNRLFKR